VEPREHFPIVVDPRITVKDLKFLSFSTNNRDNFSNLSKWSQNWSVEADRSSNIKRYFERFESKSLSKFTTSFFSKFNEIGVLHSKKRTLHEEHKEWLVLRLSSSEQDVNELEVDDILSAPVGSYIFIHEPDPRITMEFIDQYNVELNFENIFFFTYGGLRDSPPFFGGDCFYDSPSNVYSKMITSRDGDVNEWLESKVIHVRGNCDYWLLKPTGEIGYMPIEYQKPIKICAKNLVEFVEKWLSTPRPLDYNVFGEYTSEK